MEVLLGGTLRQRKQQARSVRFVVAVRHVCVEWTVSRDEAEVAVMYIECEMRCRVLGSRATFILMFFWYEEDIRSEHVFCRLVVAGTPQVFYTQSESKDHRQKRMRRMRSSRGHSPAACVAIFAQFGFSQLKK